MLVFQACYTHRNGEQVEGKEEKPNRIMESITWKG